MSDNSPIGDEQVLDNTKDCSDTGEPKFAVDSMHKTIDELEDSGILVDLHSQISKCLEICKKHIETDPE